MDLVIYNLLLLLLLYYLKLAIPAKVVIPYPIAYYSYHLPSYNCVYNDSRMLTRPSV